MVRKRERLSTDPDEGDGTRREVGKALERRLNEMRKGAGIPTKAEHEAAQANPPLPAERRLLLGASCLVLMAVASRASNTMSEILAKDGGSDALRIGGYGFLFMNLAGALGAITFLVRPGALRWVYVTCDEAAGSMGSCLIGLAVRDDDDEEIARTVVLIVAIGHLVIKNTKHAWMSYYVHAVAHCSMGMMVNVASTGADTKMLCGAICYGIAFLLKGEGSVQDAFRIQNKIGPEELSTMALGVSCLLLSECMVEQHRTRSGL